MVFFELARKNVTRKRERSLLTIVAVLLAIGSFISLLSIAEGLYQKTRLELDGRDVDLYLLPKGIRPVPALAAGSISPSTESLPPTLADELPTKYPLIDHASGVVRMTLSYQERSVVVWGIDAAGMAVFLKNVSIISGRGLQGRGEIVLGQALAHQLALDVGGTLQLGKASFQVVGLADSPSGLQASYGYVGPQDAMDLGNLKGVHEVWVHLKESASQDLGNDIMQTYPDVVAYSNEAYLGTSLELVRYAWLVQFAVASIGVLISMTAAMNTMLMSTYERLKEFGTLRALGMSRLVVVAMILTESLILSSIGGVGGILLGVVGSRIFDVAVTTLFRFSFSLASITASLILNGLLLSVGVGIVGAAIPCYIVYNMEIIRALRAE